MKNSENSNQIIASFYSKYFRFSVRLYVSALFVGFILAMFIFRPTNVESSSTLSLFDTRRFIQIATTNCLLILSIYIFSIITKWYGYFIFISNGFTLGCYLAWILKSNISLMWLILPHGIFEIPIVLLTAFIVTAGDQYVQKNIKKYFLMLGIHLVATLICAAIEAYITPLFQPLIFVP